MRKIVMLIAFAVVFSFAVTAVAVPDKSVMQSQAVEKVTPSVNVQSVDVVETFNIRPPVLERINQETTPREYGKLTENKLKLGLVDYPLRA